MQRKTFIQLLVLSFVICLLACGYPLRSENSTTDLVEITSSAPGLNAPGKPGLILSPLLLILVATGGFVFTAVVVYIAIRWFQKQSPALSVHMDPVPADVTLLPVLPAGEILKHGSTYKILKLHYQTATMNVYLATCDETGQQVTIKETVTEGDLGFTSVILDMHLSHPNILVAETAFTLPGSEHSHIYQVEPVFGDKLLAGKPAPHSLENVLKWGESLAYGLGYLHEHHVIMGQLTPNHIVIDDEGIRLVVLENAIVLDSNLADTEKLERKSADVRALAAVLQGILSQDSVDAMRFEDSFAFVQSKSKDLQEGALELAARIRKQRLASVPGQVCIGATGMYSDVGQVREVNEDSLTLIDQIPGGRCDVLALVADGVGGHQAGDVASGLTVNTLQEQFKRILEADPIPEAATGLAQMAIAANQNVYTARMQAGNNMGSTLVMAWCQQNHAVVLNVGDSRAYRLDKHTMKQLTVDHSLVERLVAIGQITREEARMHPRRSVIYRMIGEREELDYDVFTIDFMPGEALLLCSDGLSDLLTDRQIWSFWRQSEDPDKVCRNLVQAANTAGGYDNITVVIVRFDTV